MQLANLPVLLFCLLVVACSTGSGLSDLDWVLGKWQVNDSNSYEEWVKVNDDLFQGKGYQVRESGIVPSETIEITRTNDEIFYIPTVMDQNGGRPVEFRLVSYTATEVTFENKIHDFPQRIIYVKNGDSQIDARIEGEQNGQFSRIDFQLKRVSSLVGFE